MSKPQTNSKAIYDKFYEKELSATEYEEMKFNLVRYVELLIVLDRQRQEQTKQQTSNVGRFIGRITV